MTGTALALSPHLDDTAFSAGATLASLAQAGWRVVIATLFTGNVARPTGFALECQTSKGIGPEVDYMALRRAEDRAACRALGAEPIHLPLLEAPHRGYESPAALFGALREDDAAGLAVGAQVTRLFDELRPSLLLAPQAIGAHVDHVLVHLSVPVSRSVPVRYWRDWPYLARTPDAQPFAARMAALDVWTPSVLPRDREAKRLACHAYTSQLGFQFGGPEALDGALAVSGPEVFASLG